MPAYWIADNTTAMATWIAAAESFLEMSPPETYGEPEQRPDNAEVYRLPLTVNVGGVFAADYVPLPYGATVEWIRPDAEEWQPALPPGL